MKSTLCLLGGALALGWVALHALAGTGNACATAVLFDEQHKAMVACPQAPCTANGKSGTCVTNAINADRAVLWHWDSHTNPWGMTSILYTGEVEACHCRVNEGTEERPVWVSDHSPCWDVARVRGLDGAPDPHVALLGECGTDGCTAGSCIATGAYIVVTADCN